MSQYDYLTFPRMASPEWSFPRIILYPNGSLPELKYQKNIFPNDFFPKKNSPNDFFPHSEKIRNTLKNKFK